MSTARLFVVFALAGSLTSALGCSKKEETAASAAPIPKESEDIFQQRCVTCHGADGKGTGPAAAALNPKPRDYSDSAWQAQVKDEDLEKIILKGGTAVGKSALMPPNPDLEGKPDVVKGLVAKVRSFRK